MELGIRFADSELEPVTGLAQSPYRLDVVLRFSAKPTEILYVAQSQTVS